MIFTTILTFLNSYKYVILGVTVFVVLGAFGGYGYFLYKRNSELQKQLYLLQKDLDKYALKLEAINKDISGINDANERIIYTLKSQDKSYKKFRSTLYRDVYKDKKSIEDLSKKKTKLVENILNRSTKNALKELENLSK